DQSTNLSIGDIALEHPEPAVRVDVANPAPAHQGLGAFDAARDLVGGLDHGRLDVDDAEAEADLRTQLAERGLFFRRSVGGFHYDMIDVKRVEIVDEVVPTALLDRLSSVI